VKQKHKNCFATNFTTVSQTPPRHIFELYLPITAEHDSTALIFTEYTQFCDGWTNNTRKHKVSSTF